MNNNKVITIINIIKKTNKNKPDENVYKNKLDNQLQEMENALKQMNMSSLSHDGLQRDKRDIGRDIGHTGLTSITKEEKDNSTIQSFYNRVQVING